MINYIIQVVLFQVLFLVIYDVFLAKETFFNKNRGYLLITPILSFCIPFFKIPTFQKVVQEDFVIALPEIVLSPQKVIQTSIEPTTYEQSVNVINFIFWIGVALFALLFLIKLAHVLQLIYKNEKLQTNEAILVLLPKSAKAFSFFKFIFIGKAFREEQKEQIIQHELVHTKQKHTFDLLFFEILKIIMWFNPMIYIYQKRITLVHEYISDEIASTKETKETYVDGLLASFFQVENIGFVNQFYKESLIKKRISMLMKTKSKKMNQLKYLLLIPVLGSMSFYVACTENDFDKNISTELYNKNVKKRVKKLYYGDPNSPKIETTNIESYLDIYMGNELPNKKEFTYSDLSYNEQEEFDMLLRNFKEKDDDLTDFRKLKIFEFEEGRKTIAAIFDFKKWKSTRKPAKQFEDGSYSVLQTNETPIFPGCPERGTDCFFEKLDDHFQNNFNKSLPNNLGLSPGIKKAFVSFNIDLNGKVTELKVRAPHPKIKTEVERVLYSLPTVGVGKVNGKAVKVKYTLPFKFKVK